MTAAAPRPGYRGWLLFVLMLVNCLNLADRVGLAAIVPAIKQDLRLTDTELGVIQGLGFAIFYTLLGLPIARLSEIWNRTRIIAAAVAAFAFFSALTSQTRSFATLLFCRVGVGAGDAGFGPPVSSLLGDFYPVQRRAAAMTIVWLGAPVGALAGAALGGWIAQHWNWRYWSLCLAIPALLTAILIAVTIREPRRGTYDAASPEIEGVPSFREAMRFLWSKHSMRHVLLGAALAAISLNGIGQFLARYMVATFQIGSAEAGVLIGVLTVVSMASGLAIGGFGVAWLSRWDPRWFVWLPAIGLALAAPLTATALAQHAIPRLVMWLVPAHIALFIFYTPSLTIAQNMVGSAMRASSAFAVSVVLGLVGTGLGPTLVGIVSDWAAANSFGDGYRTACPGGAAATGAAAAAVRACEQASAHGITLALGGAALLLLFGSTFFWLAARTFRQDLGRHYSVDVPAAVR